MVFDQRAATLGWPPTSGTTQVDSVSRIPTESGSGDSHTVDNVSKFNRVVFDFSSSVILDKVGLSVYGDSDISIFYYSGSGWTFLEDNTGGTSNRRPTSTRLPWLPANGPWRQIPRRSSTTKSNSRALNSQWFPRRLPFLKRGAACCFWRPAWRFCSWPGGSPPWPKDF